MGNLAQLRKYVTSIERRMRIMRVGFIADLHVDLNIQAPISQYRYELSKLLESEAVELLVIGGDLTNHYTRTLKFVEDLQKEAGIPIYFIPGNHDFWEKKGPKNTRKIYELYKQHPQSLVETPLILSEEYTLVGHPAWYNHAVYDRATFQPEKIEIGKYRGGFWQDKLKMDWEATDQEVSKEFAEIIRADLAAVTTDKIILQTHMVTTPEFTMPMPHRIFDFFNAYIATDDLKNIHKDYPITHNFMGHIHFRATIQKDATKFITNSLGYRKEWRSKDLRQELKDSLVVIEI